MLPRYVALIPLMMLMGISASAAGAEADTAADEEVLRAARLPTEGPALLAIFRKRTPDAESYEHITTLIAQLGSASFSAREEASEELADYGVEAAGLLREAARHSDLEIRRRAREALTLIVQGDLAEDVFVSVLRVLGQRKPPRMTEVLLAYAPHASAAILPELGLALSSVAVREGEAHPALVRALNAKSSKQRGVAAEVLCRAGCRKQLPAVRRLLRDPDLPLRRRVALTLLEAREKAAVPVLIDLLAELPIAEAEYIESILLQLAGDTPPVGQAFQPDEQQRQAGKPDERQRQAGKPDERQRQAFQPDERQRQAGKPDLRDAWAAWWKTHGDALDLTKLELSLQWRGYVLAVCLPAGRGRGRGRNGCILEFDARGRTRWQIQGLASPVDAQVLDERRVLVTESRSGQITERNHNGDILRRIEIADNPLEARRLPNGRTLITTRNRVFEVDRNDKEVWTTKGSANDTIVAACPLRGGQIGICHRSGEFLRLDRNGKVLDSFQVGRLSRATGTHIQGLANGHILVPQYNDNKVVEFDGKGHEVWSAAYPSPISAQRLPNGRTLVAGYASNTIVELDKDGREVKSQPCLGRLLTVRGR